MMLAGDIKKNVCLRIDGRIYVVIDFLHVKPGKGNTVMRTKLRDVADGRVLERTWIVSAKLDECQVDHRQFQYLYKEGNDLVFMNNETFEQVNISADFIEGVQFLKEGDNVQVSIDAATEAILTAEIPIKTVLKVTYTEPGLKGDTATNATKPATLETGAEVRVPLFINEGDLIEIDTRDGSYVTRKS
ncbi:MAG: elongation factor P [Bacteroidaceae bacterium]|nr:elongation factor P [Bacteroidaceae bacterium]